jgi:hypothetical protein
MPYLEHHMLMSISISISPILILSLPNSSFYLSSTLASLWSTCTATVVSLAACAWREEWPMPLNGKVLQILLQSLPPPLQPVSLRVATPILLTCPTLEPPLRPPCLSLSLLPRTPWHGHFCKLAHLTEPSRQRPPRCILEPSQARF